MRGKCEELAAPSPGQELGRPFLHEREPGREEVHTLLFKETGILSHAAQHGAGIAWLSGAICWKIHAQPHEARSTRLTHVRL